jgi:hypothetical protein
MTDAMVTLQCGTAVWRFAHPLWPATLFRDAQAAVVTGNGFHTESFRDFSKNLKVFCAKSVLDDGFSIGFPGFC